METVLENVAAGVISLDKHGRVSTINRSAQMMLDFLGEGEAARAVERAVRRVLAEGTTVTPDLGGAATTDEMAEAVVRAVDPVDGEPLG